MTNRTKLIFMINSIIILIIIIGFSYRNYNRANNLNLKIIKIEQGWGYDIVYKNGIYIHQPNIPAVQKNVLFSTKKEAEKVGTLVLKKIRSNKLPTITQQELDSLNIQY